MLLLGMPLPSSLQLSIHRYCSLSPIAKVNQSCEKLTEIIEQNRTQS